MTALKFRARYHSCCANRMNSLEIRVGNTPPPDPGSYDSDVWSHNSLCYRSTVNVEPGKEFTRTCTSTVKGESSKDS